MNHLEMARVIRDRARAMRDAEVQASTVGDLGDNAELLMVLARIVEGREVDRAFGSPGDWGYSTPIGKALAATEANV